MRPDTLLCGAFLLAMLQPPAQRPAQRAGGMRLLGAARSATPAKPATKGAANKKAKSTKSTKGAAKKGAKGTGAAKPAKSARLAEAARPGTGAVRVGVATGAVLAGTVATGALVRRRFFTKQTATHDIAAEPETEPEPENKSGITADNEVPSERAWTEKLKSEGFDATCKDVPGKKDEREVRCIVVKWGVTDPKTLRDSLERYGQPEIVDDERAKEHYIRKLMNPTKEEEEQAEVNLAEAFKEEGGLFTKETSSVELTAKPTKSGTEDEKFERLWKKRKYLKACRRRQRGVKHDALELHASYEEVEKKMGFDQAKRIVLGKGAFGEVSSYDGNKTVVKQMRLNTCSQFRKRAGWQLADGIFVAADDLANAEFTFAMQSHQFEQCEVWPYHVGLHSVALYTRPVQELFDETVIITSPSPLSPQETIALQNEIIRECYEVGSGTPKTSKYMNLWQHVFQILAYVMGTHQGTLYVNGHAKLAPILNPGDPIKAIREGKTVWAALKMDYAQSYSARIAELRERESGLKTMLEEIEEFVVHFEQVMEAADACWVYYDLKVDNIGWDGKRIVLFDVGSFTTEETKSIGATFLPVKATDKKTVMAGYFDKLCMDATIRFKQSRSTEMSILLVGQTEDTLDSQLVNFLDSTGTYRRRYFDKKDTQQMWEEAAMVRLSPTCTAEDMKKLEGNADQLQDDNHDESVWELRARCNNRQ